MSLDLAAIHEAVADTIKSVVADAGAFSVKSHPSEADRPCIEVWPDGDYLNYFRTSGPAGLADVELLVRVFLSTANHESDWIQAMRMLSSGTGFASSIVDALMANRQLGGTVEDLFISGGRWNPEDRTIDIPVAIQARKVGASV
jgi:hypothetical protein